MNNQKNIIKQALNITDMQYSEMVMENAQQWMHRYFGTEEAIISALNHSGWFWKWWVNQWDNRDTEFVQITGIEYVTLPLPQDLAREVLEDYRTHHNADKLRIVPNRMVVNEVGKLIKVEYEKIKQAKQ